MIVLEQFNRSSGNTFGKLKYLQSTSCVFSSCCQVHVHLTSSSNLDSSCPHGHFPEEYLHYWIVLWVLSSSAIVTPVVVLYFATTNPITAPWGFPGFVKHWFNFSKIQFLHFWKLKLPQVQTTYVTMKCNYVVWWARSFVPLPINCSDV